MVLFINGVKNVGKTTVAQLLHERQGFQIVEPEEFFKQFADTSPAECGPTCLSKALEKAEQLDHDSNIVIPYPLVPKDLDFCLNWARSKHFQDVNLVTITAKRNVVEKRSARDTTPDKMEYVDWHVFLGVNKPSCGAKIDTSNQDEDETYYTLWAQVNSGLAQVT